MVNLLSPNSNKKLSSIGRVELEFKTPLIACKCFNKDPLETTNFIGIILSKQIYRMKLGQKTGFFVNAQILFNKMLITSGLKEIVDGI